MSACRLTIELDDPKRPRMAGESVSGVVVVTTDKDVRCKGLTATCYWSTHGRGNVARGDVELVKLFDGEWQSGKEYRYPFKLATAAWPPTHYGNLLNVSHWVHAQASLPWTTDPKTMAEFVLLATEPPTDLAPTSNTVRKSGWLGWVFAPLILIVLLLFIPLLLLLLVPLGIIAGIYWFIRVVIPAQITGKVTLTTEPKSVAPGETLKGHCEFTPKRSSQINGITWTVKCEEKCVSGSGSNRTTHNHDVLTKIIQLAGPGTLSAGQLQSFDFQFEVPPSVPPSMKFTDNEINWTSEFRVDIIKWPDWVKSIPFVVRPAAQDSAIVSRRETVEQSEDEKWLTQVIDQIIDSEDDPDRLQSVLDAVEQQVFPIFVDFQGESEEPLESDIEDEGIWLNALDPVRNCRIALFIPASLKTDQIEWSKGWRGNATVIGLDEENVRVMMKVC